MNEENLNKSMNFNDINCEESLSGNNNDPYLLLGKKTLRNEEPVFEIEDKKCDMCLETLLNPELELTECVKCKNSVHRKCLALYTNYDGQSPWKCDCCAEPDSSDGRFESKR